MANESKIWIPISQPPLSKIINQSHYSSLILPTEALGVKLRPSYCKAGTNRTTSEALPSIISIQARVKEGSNQLPPYSLPPTHTCSWPGPGCCSVTHLHDLAHDSSSTHLLMIPALPTQGIVVPAVQLPNGNVEDAASEEYCQSEGLGTVRPRAEAHRVGSILWRRPQPRTSS